MFETIGRIIGGTHYLALVLILILSYILATRSVQTERVNQDAFWITLFVCTLLVAQDVFENFAQQDPSRRDLRMFTSIAGYVLRPVAVLGFLLAIWPVGKPRWFLWIPAVLNGILYCTAVFLPLTFSFDSNYVFQRGPLGGVVFAVCILYLIMILSMIHRRFRDRRAGDLVIVYLCTLGCLGATVMDILFGGITIISAILVSSLVLYFFLRSQDLDRDALTRLWNRRVYYEDCEKNRSAVTAVASVDMNGLKQMNDELGHDAGDRALRMIGRGLHGISSKKIRSYRVGGDEFMILFIHCHDEEIKQVLITFLDDIWQAGLSVAVGLATRIESNGTLEDMIRLSDRRMYEDKSEYYQHHDRRRPRQ